MSERENYQQSYLNEIVRSQQKNQMNSINSSQQQNTYFCSEYSQKHNEYFKQTNDQNEYKTYQHSNYQTGQQSELQTQNNRVQQSIAYHNETINNGDQSIAEYHFDNPSYTYYANSLSYKYEPNDAQINNEQQNFEQNQNKQLHLSSCIAKIQKALKKIYYRGFHNRLITFYIQSLKQQQRLIRQTKQVEIKQLKQQNWPFKELFYKKIKTQNDVIMLEFVNMCASKIQATFKSYITYKRHVLAMMKLNKFKTKISAVVAGWKVWNIYNCKKIIQLRNISKNISKEIDIQIQNPHTDKIKKMRKLYANQNFRTFFNGYYEAGTWVYEVDKVFKYKKVDIKSIQRQPNNFQIKRSYQSTQIQNPVQNKRVRQRQFKKPIKKVQNNIIYIQQNYQTQNIKTNNLNPSTNKQNSGIQQKPITAKGRYVFDEQDLKNSQNEFLNQKQEAKPQINQMRNQQNSNSQKKNKLRQKNKMIKRQKYDPRKAIQQEKKRIQEEKKKAQQQRKKILQNKDYEEQNNLTIGSNLNQLKGDNSKVDLKHIKTNDKKPKIEIKEKSDKTPTKVRTKTPVKRNNNLKQPKIQPKSPVQQSREKTVQKVKKQSKLIKKDDNSKSLKIILNKKVESKVNCWANKRQSQSHIKSQQNIMQQQNSYKSKYLLNLRQKNQIKNSQSYNQVQQIDQGIQIERLKNKQLGRQFNNYQYIKQIKQKSNQGHNYYKPNQPDQQIIQEDVYQSNFLKKLAQQKGRFSNAYKKVQNQKKMVNNYLQVKQDKITQKIAQLNNQFKNLSQNRLSLTNLRKPHQQIQRKIRQNIQPQITKKKQQVYRPVQSLEDVYSSQYTDRLNNLKNKLNMLSSTRQIQANQSIPILLEDSKFVKKIFKDNTFSNLYWPQVRTMETNFLDYIKFNLTSA